MMISNADFEELFFEDDAAQSSGDDVHATAPTLGQRGTGQQMPDPLQAATLAMTAPFGAALAMMSAFGAQPPRN